MAPKKTRSSAGSRTSPSKSGLPSGDYEYFQLCDPDDEDTDDDSDLDDPDVRRLLTTKPGRVGSSGGGGGIGRISRGRGCLRECGCVMMT